MGVGCDLGLGTAAGGNVVREELDEEVRKSR